MASTRRNRRNRSTRRNRRNTRRTCRKVMSGGCKGHCWEPRLKRCVC